MTVQKQEEKPLSRSYQRVVIGLVLLIVVFLSSWSLLMPSLGMGHDLNQQARIYEMAQGLKEGNFPVIWSQNLAYGYGMPLYEFYAPLAYYIGAVFYLAGLNLTTSVEILIFLASLVTALGCFWLGKELLRNTQAAVLVTGLVTLAPYRAVDVFVRSALAESWAIAILPYVLWGIVSIVNSKKWGWLLLSVSFALLILTHNISALLALPFLLLFSVGLVLIKNSPSKQKVVTFLQLLGAGLLGLGLAAFYFIPALVEKDFTQLETFTLNGYFDIHNHFLYVSQFIEPWGEQEFGGSGLGPADEMSFFLGFPQLLVLVLCGLVGGNIIASLISKKTLTPVEKKLSLAGGITALSLLLTLHQTIRIWEITPLAEFIQFPWRLLAISILFIGLMGGLLYLQLSKTAKPKLVLVIGGLLLLSNATYFRSGWYEDHSPLFEQYQAEVKTRSSSLLFDYLPKDLDFFYREGAFLYKTHTADIPLPAESFLPRDLVEHKAATVITEKTTFKAFQITLDKTQTISLLLAYYPGWQVTANNQPLEVKANEYGLVSFTLPEGTNRVTVELIDTQVRWWSKVISGISLAGLGVLLVTSLIRSRNSDTLD